MRGIVRGVVAVLVGLALRSPLEAQACGTTSDPTSHLLRHREMFAGPDGARFRESLGIEPIGIDDAVEVVRDAAVCRHVIHRFMADLGLPGKPYPESYAVYRYGEFLALEMLAARSTDPNVWLHTQNDLYVYPADGGRDTSGSTSLPTDPVEWEGRSAICGSWPAAPNHLGQHRYFFTEERFAATRDLVGLRALQPGDPVGLVYDREVCADLLDRVRSRLGLDPEIRFDPALYAVFRYGDYFAVEIASPERPGVTSRGRDWLSVFGVEGDRPFITSLNL